MSAAARTYLFYVILSAVAGLLVGWFYGEVLAGLVIALAAIVIWHVRHLLRFDRAIKQEKADRYLYGDGIWQQLFSRYAFERTRARRRKLDYRNLLKEIRRSTDAMPDGAIVLNADNEILVSNRAAGGLVGIKRRKDRGQRIDNIVRDPKVTRLVNRDEVGGSIDVPSPIADGHWLNIRVVPYGVGQKLMLIRDITERTRLHKTRRDFVANASHELRSPLTVISGYLDALADDAALPEEWSQPLRQMQSQATRMRNILSEMLELSRLEGTGVPLAAEAIDMRQLFALVLKDIKDLHPDVEILSELETNDALLGASTEIASVVVNLLSNAIRHTPTDGEIKLRWSSDDDGAELAVIDSGIGIDETDIPRLTERFFRVNRGRSRDNGGFGLGLAIVKHILIRHGAELHVTSEVGVGSQFVCRFPRNRVSFAAPDSL